jgi:hypothetical protein
MQTSDERGFAGMRLTKVSQMPGKTGLLAFARRQVPQIDQVLYRQIVALGQLACDKFFDFGQQVRLSTGEGVQMLLPGDGCQVFLARPFLGCFPRLFALALRPERLGGGEEFSHRPARHFGSGTAASPAAIQPGAKLCAEDCILPGHESDEQLVLFLHRELGNPGSHILALGWSDLLAWTSLGGHGQQVLVNAKEIDEL